MKKTVKYFFFLWLLLITFFYVFTSVKLMFENNVSLFGHSVDVSLFAIFASVVVFLMWFLMKRQIYHVVLPLFLFILFLVLLVAILSKTIFDLAVFLWLLTLGSVVGRRIVDLVLKGQTLFSIERVVFSIPIGFGLFALLIFVLSLTEYLYQSVVLFILSILSLVFIKDMLTTARGALVKVKSLMSLIAGEQNRGFLLILVGMLLINFIINFIGSVAPEIQYDALNYHLTVPRFFIERHGFIELPHILQSYFAKSTEMLYALAMVISSQIAAKFFSLTFGVLTVFSIISFGSRFFKLETGIIAASLFYISPIVSWSSTTTYIDLSLTFYIFSAIYGIVLWRKTAEKGFLFLSGILFGLALATKLNCALMLAPVGISVIIISLFLQKSSLRESAIHLTIFVSPILVLASPWYFVTYLHTGNPIFPFYNAIFKSPLWPHVNMFFNFKNFGMGYELKDFVILPWNITFHSSKFGEAIPDGFIGLSVLFALPTIFFIVARFSGIVELLFFSAVGYVGIWFAIGQYLRYYLPALPLFCLLGAVAFAHFRERQFCNLIMSIGLLFTFPVTLMSFWNIPEKIPYKVAFGLESKEDYLSRVLGGYYQAFKFLEKDGEPKKVKVLLFGNSYHFYSSVHMENLSTSLNTRDMIPCPSGERLKSLLLNKGFTHILIDKFILENSNYKPPIADADFLKESATLVFALPRVSVYKIVNGQSSAAQEESQELLINGGFEQTRNGDPAEWNKFNNPIFDYTGKKSRSGKGAIRVNEKNFFTQTVTRIEGGKLYTLSHCSKAERDGQAARLQINWIAGGKIVRPDIEVVSVPRDKWACNSMSVSAPSEAKTAIIYASVHQQSEVWFDDFSFVEGAK